MFKKISNMYAIDDNNIKKPQKIENDNYNLSPQNNEYLAMIARHRRLSNEISRREKLKNNNKDNY